MDACMHITHAHTQQTHRTAHTHTEINICMVAKKIGCDDKLSESLHADADVSSSRSLSL